MGKSPAPHNECCLPEETEPGRRMTYPPSFGSDSERKVAKLTLPGTEDECETKEGQYV
jgi:hypothetical protein